MKIVLADSALNDLQEIKNYYQIQGVPHVGMKFIKDILIHIEILPANPEIGRKVPEFNESIIRELIHPPYRIVYIREELSIKIIRIWRSERLLKLDNS